MSIMAPSAPISSVPAWVYAELRLLRKRVDIMCTPSSYILHLDELVPVPHAPPGFLQINKVSHHSTQVPLNDDGEQCEYGEVETETHVIDLDDAANKYAESSNIQSEEVFDSEDVSADADTFAVRFDALPVEVINNEDAPSLDNFQTSQCTEHMPRKDHGEQRVYGDAETRATDADTVNMMIDIAAKVSERVCESATAATVDVMVSKLRAMMDDKITELQTRMNLRIRQKEKELEKLRCAHEDTRMQVIFAKEKLERFNLDTVELHRFLYDKGMTDITDLNGFDSSAFASDNDALSDSSSHNSGVCEDQLVASDNDARSDSSSQSMEPPSAHALFVQERAAHFKAMMPHANPDDVVTKIVKEWRSLDKDKKSVYLAKAAELQAEFLGKGKGTSSGS